MTGVLAQAAAALVVFAEAGFPAAEVRQPLPEIGGARVATSMAALDSALRDPNAVLVWRHGSAFPLEGWPIIRRFLEAGGNLVLLGGEPFTRPVSGRPGQRTVGPRTVTYLKALRLNQSHAVPAGGALVAFADPYGTVPDRALAPGSTVWTLEPKLAGPPRFPGQDGSPGERDGIVRPLAFVHLAGGDRRFPAAAASVVVDWLGGAYAAGRWVIRPMDAIPGPDEVALLLAEGRREPLEITVTPTYGTFHAGEPPTVAVAWRRAAGATGPVHPVRVLVTSADGRGMDSADVVIGGEPSGRQVAVLPGGYQPGLYRVQLRGENLRPVSTGFWVFDPVLFASGDLLGFDGYTLLRAGRPEPVIGTTVMSHTMHREFLEEPDAAVWEDTFAELADLGINLARTGVWAGWERILGAPDSVDEGWLRALEAYYLSARRHGIPVLFTFFAFVPPAYDGESPYFDPRSLARQRAYVGAVARRFAGTREMLWDLINEPSFASPRHVWLTRPNGDRWEDEAFRDWLRRTYGTGAGDTAWATVVRRRWRVTPETPLAVPGERDFDDASVFGDRRPYRARDYVRFAQEGFLEWARTMRQAIRDAGSQAAVTVGQDEGGHYDRPSPLYHHDALEFTSMHTWWLNDALLWDGVMARVAGKPLLVSETGIMQRERLDGTAARAPDESARLLARKLAYAFAAGAFGAVEWVYDVNPYMDSDNEVAIGLRRADGSYKPEHAVLRRYAAFVRRTRHLFEAPLEPDVAVVVPSADQYSPRGLGAAATRRAIETLADLGVRLRVVPEYRAAAMLGRPRLIVLPATRGIADSAWSAITEAVRAGATLLASGYFEYDDAGLPAFRVGGASRPLALVEPADPAAPDLPPLRYPLDILQSAEAASGTPAGTAVGQGTILHVPVPLEWAVPGPAQGLFYARALAGAGLVPAPAAAGVHVTRIPFRSATLVVVVNERADEQTVLLGGLPGAADLSVTISGGDAQMLWVGPEGRVLDSTAGR